jgi:carbon storage regulator
VAQDLLSSLPIPPEYSEPDLTSVGAHMLVLNRKCGEELIIPQYGIVMTILEIHGQQVRVGISAQPDVKVHRGEVWTRIQEESVEKEGLAAEGT